MLVGSRLAGHARVQGDAVALDDGVETLTWRALAELVEVTRRTAMELPGSEGRADVALLADWSPRFVATFLGLGLAGWGVGVLDPTWTDAELAGAIAQLDPAAVVIDRNLVREDWLADGWRPGTADLAGAQVWRRETEAGAPVMPATPDRVFYVGFTSGSSGRPKAFARTHRSWWESFERFAEYVPPVDRVVVPGALSSSHFLFGLLHAMHAGVPARTVRANATILPAALLADPDGDVAIYVVPAMLGGFCSAVAQGSLRAPSVVFCAGARLEQAVLAEVRGAMPSTRFVEYYGASELSFVAIRRDGDGAPAGSVGRAFPGVEVAILDDRGRPVPVGGVGTIAARSDLMFAGYRGDVPASAARRLPEGWVTVGDRGRLDDDGFLWVDGRGSTLVITGGVNVQPEEVEEVVASAPGVRSCVVVGLPDPAWGEIVCAAVVEEQPGTLRRTALRGAIGASLMQAKRPRRYIRWSGQLPVGRSGKVDRLAVRDAILRGAQVEEIR